MPMTSLATQMLTPVFDSREKNKSGVYEQHEGFKYEGIYEKIANIATEGLE